MKMHPQKPILRKIALRRERSDHADTGPSWVRFISIDMTDTARPGCSKLVPGRRILTPREMDVLRLVARGETDQGIANKLYLSRRTVNTHVSNILSKLDVSTRREAVIAAARIGILL